MLCPLCTEPSNIFSIIVFVNNRGLILMRQRIRKTFSAGRCIIKLRPRIARHDTLAAAIASEIISSCVDGITAEAATYDQSRHSAISCTDCGYCIGQSVRQSRPRYFKNGSSLWAHPSDGHSPHRKPIGISLPCSSVQKSKPHHSPSGAPSFSNTGPANL